MIDRPDIVKKIETRNTFPVKESEGDVLVKVKANPSQPQRMAGFYIGPRYPGEQFRMARNKDGSLPKGSWFTVLGQPEVKANAEDMA